MTLRLDAELALEGEHAFEVWTEDGTVVVNAPSLWALRELQSLVDSLPVDPDEAALPPGIAAPDLEVRVRRATVARTASGDGGWPTIGGTTPDWRGVLVAAVRALG